MTLNALLNTPSIDIDSFVKNMPGYLLIKDLNSMYLTGNTIATREFGFKNSEDLYGLNDFTVPHRLSEIGTFFLNLDSELQQNGDMLHGLYAFPFQSEIRPFRFSKYFIKDKSGAKVAIYSHAEECSDPIITNIINELVVNDPTPHWTERKISANCYIFNKEYSGINLTKLESCCFFYLIRNKSISQISNLLNVSVKTVHSYIDNIKNQLKLASIGDLIDLSIENNYLNVVPPGIISLKCSHYRLSPIMDEYSQHTDGIILQNQRKKSAYDNIKFTPREMDCVKLVIQGKKTKEIASELNLSPRTIEAYLNTLKVKLSCRDKIALTIKLRDILSEAGG